jgi:hypothetical protein
VSVVDEDWAERLVLPFAKAGDSATRLLNRLKTRSPQSFTEIRSGYGGKDPDDVMRRTIARRLARGTGEAKTFTVSMVDYRRGLSGTDRVVQGVQEVRFDLTPLPGGPAFVLAEYPTPGAGFVLHLAKEQLGAVRRTKRRRTWESVSTVPPESGWDRAGEELFFPGGD